VTDPSGAVAPVGLLLVSHSSALAEATEALIRQMTGTRVAIARAAGAGEGGRDLGTNPLAIVAAAEALAPDCGSIIVLMDIGSAVLSADMARDLLPEEARAKLHLSPAAFVEGAIAAATAAAAGLPIDRILAEAAAGLAGKDTALGAPEAASPITTPPVTAPLLATARREARIADPAGLHLRPAAAFVAMAAGYDAAIRVTANGRSARGDSLTALLTLDAAGGAVTVIEASGPQADIAVAALAALLAQTPLPAQTPESFPSPAPDRGGGPAGGPIPVSPGRAVGPLHVVRRVPPVIPDQPVPDRDAACLRLRAALDAAFGQYTAGGPIMAAQAALLRDPALVDPAYAAIRHAGLNEAASWWRSVLAARARYDALATPYLRDRGQDVMEIGGAVLRILLPGTAGLRDLEIPESPCILLVESLTAAEAASLPPSVVGVLDRQGGATSHAAILLRGAGIPALAGVVLDPLPHSVAFDGASAAIVADPDDATRRHFTPPPPRVATAGPSTLSLPDGTTLELWANVSTVRDSLAAVAAGACGIGLARTEILFLDRRDAPDEAEQGSRIAALLSPFRGRPVIVRVLDAGADKPMPFLALDPEDNPALGVRGLRAMLRRPAFFHTHLRAILRAGAGHDLRIMLPMVTVAEEMRQARAILAAACATLDAPVPPLGAMIEVPAAALRIGDLVPVADFFSIGTNDLTQYVMAAERGCRDLAPFADAAQAAVIDLCAHVARHAEGRPVSVCGEAAGAPRTARLLVQAGVRRLSMGAPCLDAIRAAFSP
jgi:multiphosphoryl transfer protein